MRVRIGRDHADNSCEKARGFNAPGCKRGIIRLSACRLFSFISRNWRGKPLRDLATIINLIRATTTETGLRVYCDIDENHDPKGIAIDKATIDALNIRREPFHGEWNYTFMPPPKDEAVI